MSLVDLLNQSPSPLDGKQLHQIIAFAGSGKLLDASATSLDFRAFLSQIPPERLKEFVTECLTAPFPNSGLALQDVVNEIGARIGFAVTPGKYQGTKGQIGNDGLWKLPNGHHVVVEVKTTDVYRVKTESIAGYRRALATAGKIDKERSSVLLVVGREETGELEAQIRGSPYAWEIRIISASALLRLMSLKVKLDDPKTINQISEILIPKEYTRLDQIVDLVFSAAEDVIPDDEVVDDVENPEPAHSSPLSPVGGGVQAQRVAFQVACIARLSKREGTPLLRQTRSTFAAPNGSLRAVCAVSKEYESGEKRNYWFGFHPHQEAYLAGAGSGYVVLGCGSPEQVLAVPVSVVKSWLDSVWMSTPKIGEAHWHIVVRLKGGKLWLDRKKGMDKLDVTAFVLT